MPTIESHLSDKLQNELARARTMHEFITQSFPSTITIANNKTNILAAYVHLASDLYGSILQLIAGGGPYDGGAFALVRPLVEASVMGQWLYFCASDDNVERAYVGQDIDPGLPNMMDSLDRAIGEAVFARLREKVKTLHGFTHGGIEQLGRRFDAEGNLRANYSDEEKIEVLRSTTSTFTLLSMVFCKVVSAEPETDTRSAGIEAKFAAIYGTST